MNNKTKQQITVGKRNRRVSSISWRLFGALAVFIILTLVIIWIFQVVLLNIFYEKSKINEFYDAESEIMESTGDIEALRKVVFIHSIDSDMCIRVFKIANGTAEEMVGSKPNSGCVIHSISSEGLSHLYKKAVDNDGRYIQKVSNMPDAKEASSTVYISIRDVDGDRYVLMFDSDLAPLNATVETLERQFGWITCILIIGALVWALFVSRIICVPMKKNEPICPQTCKGRLR